LFRWRGPEMRPAYPSLPQAAQVKSGLTWPIKRLSSRPLRTSQYTGIFDMAKPTTQLIKMVSTADTGYFYVAKKNPRTLTEKLQLRKYDPVVRKHVIFKESKIR